MNRCQKCQEYGLEFHRKYKPEEYIEGNPDSKVWIVGLNPAQDSDWTDSKRDVKDLSNYFQDKGSVHGYFKHFYKVSPKLFEGLGKYVAHTDLVKCSSKSWPPKNCKTKEVKSIVNKCSSYLLIQICTYKPKVIICNGAAVSHYFQETLKVHRRLSDTAYISDIGGHDVLIILSGFVGRLDNFSKRRLGYEIEKYTAQSIDFL